MRRGSAGWVRELLSALRNPWSHLLSHLRWVGAADPDLSPATRNSSALGLVFTPVARSPSSFVFDLSAFLLQMHVCVGGSAWAQGCSENTGRSGFGLPSPPSGLPREEKDGVFQHQTGRDSSGKKRDVSSPSQEGSLLQKMPEGPLSGPAQEGGQWNPTGRTPRLWSLHHSTGAFAQPSPECFSLCPRKWPPERQTRVPTSAQLSASATLILKLPAESKVGGEGLGKGVGGCWALKAQDEGDQQLEGYWGKRDSWHRTCPCPTQAGTAPRGCTFPQVTGLRACWGDEPAPPEQRTALGLPPLAALPLHLLPAGLGAAGKPLAGGWPFFLPPVLLQQMLAPLGPFCCSKCHSSLSH